MTIPLLGKLPRTQDPDRDIFLSDLRCTAPVTLPIAPPVVNYSAIPGGWGMDLNDQLGDCGVSVQPFTIPPMHPAPFIWPEPLTPVMPWYPPPYKIMWSTKAVGLSSQAYQSAL